MSPELPRTSTDDRLEADLRHAYGVPVPAPSVQELDHRIRDLIEAERRRVAAQGRRRRSLMLVLAIVVTLAAMPVVRFFDGWGPSFGRVFELATPIGKSVTHDGYRVTVVRAYGDPSSLRLGLTVEDLEDRGWAEINVAAGTVTDEAGRGYAALEGTFRQPTRATGESWLRYAVPPEAADVGTRRIRVAVDGLSVRPNPAPTLPGGEIDLDRVWTSVPGSWSFEFEVPFYRARTAKPGVTVTAGGIRATFEELTVTPASTELRLRFDGLPQVEPDWAWNPSFRLEHDGRELVPMSMSPGSVLDVLIIEAEPGFEDVSGTWTITIDEFVRDVPDPNSEVTTEQERLVGPWPLRFESP